MAIVVEGPNLGGGGYDEAYDIWLIKQLKYLVASEETSSIGASVQKSGDTSQSAAMIDQIAGRVGPMIGKWDPEASCRMIQEF